MRSGDCSKRRLPRWARRPSNRRRGAAKTREKGGRPKTPPRREDGGQPGALPIWVNALGRLFEAAAPALGAQPEQLEAVDGKIQVKGSPAKSLTWKEACRKLGTASIAEMGSGHLQEGGV